MRAGARGRRFGSLFLARAQLTPTGPKGEKRATEDIVKRIDVREVVPQKRSPYKKKALA
jgi:hypothetical protein